MLRNLFIAFVFLASPAAFAQRNDVSVASAPIPASVRNDIVAAIARGFTDQGPEEPAGRQIALHSWFRKIQLAQDKSPVIVVSGGPDDPNNGATGNRDIWLFQQTGNHARLILQGGGWDLAPQGHTFHHGMLDVNTPWNMSCCSGSVTVYRFDGTRYKCLYSSEYTEDEDEKWHEGPHVRCAN